MSTRDVVTIDNSYLYTLVVRSDTYIEEQHVICHTICMTHMFLSTTICFEICKITTKTDDLSHFKCKMDAVPGPGVTWPEVMVVTRSEAIQTTYFILNVNIVRWNKCDV